MRRLAVLHSAAGVVFARQDVDRDLAGVDFRGGFAQVIVDQIIVEVAQEGRRPARRIDLAGLLSIGFGRSRTHQGVHRPRLVFVADLRVPKGVQALDVALDIEAALE